MTLRPAKQTIAIHILPNISRSKGNQTMKIEYKMCNLFVEKSYTKFGREIFPDLFLKNQI